MKLNTGLTASPVQSTRLARTASARSAKRPAYCAAQLELPPTQGSTGTYTGQNIQQPLIGNHFLHIDDFSKEVSPLLSRTDELCEVATRLPSTRETLRRTWVTVISRFSYHVTYGKRLHIPTDPETSLPSRSVQMSRYSSIFCSCATGAASDARHRSQGQGNREVWRPDLQAFRWENYVYDFYKAFHAYESVFRNRTSHLSCT